MYDKYVSSVFFMCKGKRRERMFFLVCLVSVLASVSFCSAEEYWFRKDGSLKFFNAQTNTQRVGIDIEIAEGSSALAQGLMYRKKLEPLHGMLFIFGEEGMRYFYMKNTSISLDIIFINADKKIVKIHKQTTPFSLTTLPSEKPAQYVVEVNADFCNKHGITAGDSMSFERD